MNVGTAKVDITPQGPVDLTGFLVRAQPSTGVLDPIFARALYVESGSGRLLWVHADLLGFERPLVARFRKWARSRLGLAADQVILSATHNHAAPATMRLLGCGRFQAAYVGSVVERMKDAAESAAAGREEADLVAGQTTCDLAIDRRGKASAHTDPRLSVLAWRRAGGTMAAAIVNYAMHNVSLGGANRLISAETSGRAAAALEQGLPGSPVTLFTVGPAGNVNPPRTGVDAHQMKAWGDLLAEKAREALAAPRALGDRLVARSAALTIPLDVFDADRLSRYAAAAIARGERLPEDVRPRFRRAVRRWRDKMARLAAQGRPRDRADVEIAAVALGDLWIAGINAEVFSRMADRLRQLTGRDVLVVAYANGVFGYLPTAEAFEEGGYEPAESFIYYGTFPLKADAFEQVARRAAELIVRPGE
jgi:hypothetical protein